MNLFLCELFRIQPGLFNDRQERPDRQRLVPAMKRHNLSSLGMSKNDMTAPLPGDLITIVLQNFNNLAGSKRFHISGECYFYVGDNWTRGPLVLLRTYGSLSHSLCGF